MQHGLGKGVRVLYDRLGHTGSRGCQCRQPLHIDFDTVVDGLMLRQRQPEPKTKDLCGGNLYEYE